MTTNIPAKIARCTLWFAPIIIVPAALLASLPWLKEQDNAISLGISAAVTIFVMSYAIFLSTRVNRRLDEVEIAGQRFAQTKGMTIGWIAAGLVMIVPPAMNGLVELATTIGDGSPDRSVRVGFVIGVMLVILLQTLAMAAGSVWWGRQLRGRS